MKIDLDVIHSSTIKRKKTSPKLAWIGNEKENICVLDSQKITEIDPNNGRLRAKKSRIKSYFKSIVCYSISDNGLYFVCILQNGDLIIWNKDIDTLKTISGLPEFSLKLGNHKPNVYMSNDMKKIVLITSRNKIFVWECDDNGNTSGNWSDIVASKDIKTVEDSKELVVHVKFNQNEIEGTTATCCFMFNYENQIVLNVLRIKWHNQFSNSSECRFDTIWLTHYLTLNQTKEDNTISESVEKDKSRLKCLYTRGAYVIRISHSSNLLAIAINQKSVKNSMVKFMSISTGHSREINLRNYGLNQNAQGRKYWVQELCWTYDDLYLVGITKHGAIFLASRLGQLLFIHAVGKEIDMGPALFLTIHPLIITREYSNTSLKNDDISINSTLDNDKNQKQIFSITAHSHLPILLCSDGFLMCILKIQTAFSTQTRLIRELVHESIDLLNSISEKNTKNNSYIINLENQRIQKTSSESNIPDWGLKTTDQMNPSDKDTDSGVDSNNEPKTKNRSNSLTNQKIAEGKIIFSFLPQVLPLSLETFDNNSLINRMELSIEYLISSWSLIVSSSYNEIFQNLYEYDKIAKAIEHTVTHFTYLFMSLNELDFNNSQIFGKNFQHNENFKSEIIYEIFFSFIKTLKFDVTKSHVFNYVSKLVEKFTQSLIKYDTNEPKGPRLNFLTTIFNFLNCIENLLRLIYNFEQNELFCVQTDPIQCSKTLDYLKEMNNFKPNVLMENETSENSHVIETDSLEKSNQNKTSLILVKTNHKKDYEFIDLLMVKCWQNLLHYTYKYKRTLQSINSLKENPLNDLDLLILHLERHLHKVTNSKNLNGIPLSLKINSIPIRKASSGFKINKADLIYLNLGNLNAAIEFWLIQLNKTSEKESIIILHKIFYSCLSNYEIKKFVVILEKLLDSEFNKYSPNFYTKFSLFSNLFKNLQTLKPIVKLPIGILTILKSLARFIALYLMNNDCLFYYTINKPRPMPSLLNLDDKKSQNLLSKDKITQVLNDKSDGIDLMVLFNADKVVEIFLSCELYDETLFFLNSLNDWKSSFMLSSMLKESKNYDKIKLNSKLGVDYENESQLSIKICSLLGFDKIHNLELHLMEKAYLDSASLILKELLICSVMTKSNILDKIFQLILKNLINYTGKLCEFNLIVSDNFYLPAPPIYCAQIHSENDLDDTESKFRNKICVLTKCFIALLTCSNLHVALIKWYLDNLVLANRDMKNKHGIKNYFKLNRSLSNLLSSIRYQKIGYIPENIFKIFRDFVAILFFIDLRDKFSANLRQYTKLLGKNSYNTEQFLEASVKLIEYGNLLLSYEGFLGSNKVEIQDIIISTIAKLVKYNNDLDLEQKLAECLVKNSSENLTLKLKKLTFYNEETFDFKLKTEQVEELKIKNLYGSSEEGLFLNQNVSKCGAFGFERSYLLDEFLELFFKLGFDQTENWANIIQNINSIPLLPEFHQTLRDKELNQNEFKQYIIKNKRVKNESSLKRKLNPSPSDENLDQSELRIKKGLFRSYSLKSLDKIDVDVTPQKSVSSLNLTLKKIDLNKDNFKHEFFLDQPLSLMDFGDNYHECSNLAIWLIKWSNKFQKILIENHKAASQFTNGKYSNIKSKTTIKINSLNANMLVGLVYLADDNNLEWSSRNTLNLEHEKMPKKIDFDDDFTQVTRTQSPRIKSQKAIMAKKFNNNISPDESTSLDISSYNELEFKNKIDDVIKPNLSEKILELDHTKNETFIEKLTNTLDITEYYNFDSLKNSNDFSKLDHNKDTSQSEKVIETVRKSKKKKSVVGSFDFVNNIFKRSQSKSPSKDVKNEPIKEKKIETQTITPKPQIQETTSSSSSSTNIQQIIRDELKRIVQIQHDTVMNLLNGETNIKPLAFSPTPPVPQSPMIYPDNTQIQSQLFSILKQQNSNFPSEFVIETTVKKVTGQNTEHIKIQANQQNETYFMKTFDKPSKKSKFINIPLLNINQQNQKQHEQVNLPLIQNENRTNFKLLDLGEKRQKNDVQLLSLGTLRHDDKQDKHVRNFTEKIQQSHKNKYPLLVLNQSKLEEEKIIEEPKPIKKEEVIIEKVIVVEEKKSVLTDAQVQVDKPIYDGYILKPGAFENNLDEFEQENFVTSAQAHYDSTKHLRIKKDEIKKTVSTSTDETIKTSYTLPPDILFKLKFDPGLKDRQNDTNQNHDFINVADLDSNSVEDILKLIDMDQKKRVEKVIKPKENVQTNVLVEELEEKQEVVIQDQITHKLLNEIKQETKDDEIKETIREMNESMTSRIGKNKMFNKIKFIDEKIRLMNEMADEMTSDYTKYDKMVDKIQILDDLHTEIVKTESEEKIDLKKIKKIDTIRKFKPVERDINIRDLSKKVIPTKKVKAKMDVKKLEIVPIESLNLSDEILSEMNEKEEEKLKLILDDNTNRKSVSDILKETFKDEDNKASSTNVDKTIRIKMNRNVSPIVKKEKELSEKRELMHEKYSLKREEQAKNLLKDIMNETNEIKNIESARDTYRKKSPMTKKKFILNSSVHDDVMEIPPLILDTSFMNLDMTLNDDKPSLMAKTIQNLKSKEEMEHQKAERLLNQLEKRASGISKENKEPPKQRIIKPLASIVRLQDPNKLRSRPLNKPITYAEQLLMHQKVETLVDNPQTNMNELYKVYGSKRVKGIYKNKFTGHVNRPVKTYTQMLKDLKPSELTYKVSEQKGNVIKNNQVKKEVKKSRVGNKINTVRYSPYNQMNLVVSKDIEDLVKWSLDDNLKKIIYDEKQSKPSRTKVISRKKIQEMDQDTLADSDLDYMKDEIFDENVDYLGHEQSDYVSQVNLDDLLNISLSTESAISCIDWDQIDQIVGVYKK
ncbi:unnamed protein product [Brachionus calyciflorus]|uniref:Uncharacterized protein n=1 Tax=Brachionus calyciflorus TaxID=104777 RepID=A0A813NAR4_9BILA|nr:unnamed protein product [Brachionus calyciflorus]